MGELKESHRTIKGFGGAKHSSHIMVGTIKWKWCDDEGKVHKHIIPNSYYVPNGKAPLLSPKHWAKSKQRKDRADTGEHTNAYQCKLYWGDNGKYTLTIPLTQNTNIATFSLAPGYRNFNIYCKEAAIVDADDEKNPITVSNDTDDEEGESSDATALQKSTQQQSWSSTASPSP